MKAAPDNVPEWPMYLLMLMAAVGLCLAASDTVIAGAGLAYVRERRQQRVRVLRPDQWAASHHLPFDNNRNQYTYRLECRFASATVPSGARKARCTVRNRRKKYVQTVDPQGNGFAVDFPWGFSDAPQTWPIASGRYRIEWNVDSVERAFTDKIVADDAGADRGVKKSLRRHRFRQLIAAERQRRRERK
jgi:hypothetical protein